MEAAGGGEKGTQAREGVMLDPLYHKTKQNMFGLGPLPQTPACQTPWPHGTWEGRLPCYIELSVISGVGG